MPRTSRFLIRLSSAEAAELHRRSARYTLPYFQVQRAKMILMAAEGLTNDEIAKRLDTRRDVVSMWRKRFFTEPLAGLEERARPGRPGLFPPELVVQVKALACELPSVHKVPLSRWSTSDLAREVCQTGLVASISGSTFWRWLHQDAIRPWYHRSWIFPKDPEFVEKAGRLLDLYSRQWEEKPLKSDEFVICADEKTSIQARRRLHPTEPCQPGRSRRVENRYKRGGAWVYLSALDVDHARVFGRCEGENGIAPFDRLVEQVMTRPPYRNARCVFWIVDNCSVHRGQTAVERLRQRYPRQPQVQLVHAPTHDSWLNQVEIYFSIVQRKVLTPNDFRDLDELAERLLDFQYYWEATAQPFDWRFTRRDE